MYYNIHDIINIKSDIEVFELEYFKTDNELKDLDLIIGNDTSDVTYTDMLCSLSIKTDECTYLGVSKLISSSKHVLYVNLVEPLIRLLLIPKGYILLHLACMEKNGDGLMISAPPDTGKTSCVLKCLKNSYDNNKGISLLSDDMIIAGSDGRIFSYPKPFTISSHTLDSVFDMKTDIWYRIRSRVHSKDGRTAYKGMGNIDWLPMMGINALAQIVFKPPKLFPSKFTSITIGKDAVPNKLFFLSNEFEGEKNISREDAVKLIMSNTDNAYITPPYNKIFPKLNINGISYNDLIAKESGIAINLIKNIEPFVIGRKDFTWYDYILKNFN